MILEGIDQQTLRRAVGHIPGTPLPGQTGNVALAGHRDTFFRALQNIRKGDEITLQTLSGLYRYRVDTTNVVDPEETRVLDNSDEAILTLVTCYPFSYLGPAPKRFIVRAHKLAATTAGPASVDVKPGVIGAVPLNRAHVGLRVGTCGRLNYSTFSLRVLVALG